jgi:hypothetical protein
MDFPWAAATGWPFALEARTKMKNAPAVRWRGGCVVQAEEARLGAAQH